VILPEAQVWFAVSVVFMVVLSSFLLFDPTVPEASVVFLSWIYRGFLFTFFKVFIFVCPRVIDIAASQ